MADIPDIPDTLETLRVPISSLKHYGDNPRRGDIREIASSLTRHGQYRPIVVNARTQEVLAGNHTLAAARHLGWDEIAATFVDVDDDTAARIVLIDNRSNDLAGYDDRALAGLLQSLPDLDGTGFGPADLDQLLASLQDDVPPPAPPGGVVRNYAVVIECRDEAHQQDICEELEDLGHEYRAVTT